MYASWMEPLFANTSDYAAIASFTADTSLLATFKEQPKLPAGFFDQGNRGFGRTVCVLARGVLSVTGTPTYTFTARLCPSSFSLTGAAVGVSSAITTISGVTNKLWVARLELTCYAPGIGTNATTLSGSGSVKSPAGFAAPYEYALEPTTPDTATWTATVDNSVDLYLNLSVACSASSASNTLTLKQLLVWGW